MATFREHLTFTTATEPTRLNVKFFLNGVVYLYRKLSIYGIHCGSTYDYIMEEMITAPIKKLKMEVSSDVPGYEERLCRAMDMSLELRKTHKKSENFQSGDYERLWAFFCIIEEDIEYVCSRIMSDASYRKSMKELIERIEKFCVSCECELQILGEKCA